MFGIFQRDLLKKVCVVLAFGSVVGARAGTLYTIRTSDDELQTFDTIAHTFTNVAHVSAAFDFGDLAYDGSTMYMTQGFKGPGLYKLNLTNGNATLVGSTGSSNMFGLAFDGSGNLFGGASTGVTGFYSINKNTGAASLIGNPAINLDGLAYLPTTGQMIGAYAGPGSLYSINTATGSPTQLTNGPFFDNCGMTYDPDTKLLWLVDWSGNVMSFDPNNSFARTLVLTGQGAHDGLAGIAPAPEPATLTGIGLGVLALLRRRRK